MRKLQLWLIRVQHFLSRIHAAMQVDPHAAKCPGCQRSDEFCDRSQRPRINHRPATLAVRVVGGGVVFACIAHVHSMEREIGLRLIQPRRGYTRGTPRKGIRIYGGEGIR